jgi:zinc protease
MKRLSQIVIISAALYAGHARAVENSFTTSELPTGLDVVMMESHKVPLVTLVLASKAGAMTEDKDTNGLTHLWEHMFFKGNKNLKNQEAFNAKIRELGITYNGDTSAEKVRYYFTLPSSFLEEGVKFMADAISSPLLEQKELERERRVVLDEYNRNASRPSFYLYQLKQRLIFGEQDYLRDALGDDKVIASATREQLLKIKDEVFVPSNSAMLVAGDFDPAELQKLLEKHFADWKDPKGWKPKRGPAFPPFPKTTKVVMTHPDARNVNFDFTYEGPNAKDSPKDTFVADVLISLLGHKSGKFFKKYIDSGLLVQSGLSYPTQAEAGLLTLYGVASADNYKRTVAMLVNEPKEWTKPDYFSQAELEDVRRSLLVNYKYEVNQPSEYVKTLAFWWAITGLDYYRGYLDNLAKVTLPDIRAFATKYFANKPYVESTFLSPEDAKKIGIKDNSKPLLKKYFNI